MSSSMSGYTSTVSAAYLYTVTVILVFFQNFEKVVKFMDELLKSLLDPRLVAEREPIGVS